LAGILKARAWWEWARLHGPWQAGWGDRDRQGGQQAAQAEQAEQAGQADGQDRTGLLVEEQEQETGGKSGRCRRLDLSH
jgi:hypothetical protein